MNGKAAIGAVLLSAVVMGGVYAWRWLTGHGALPATAKLSAGKLIGYGPQVSPEGYLVAWGIVYGGLSLLSTIAPGLAGSLALLILLTGAIANFGSASETALGLVKLKTGTALSGPEGEGSSLASAGLPASAAAGLSGGFSGGMTPLARPGEHVPGRLPPEPSKVKVKVKPHINWKRLEQIIKHGGPKGHATPEGIRAVIRGTMTLSQLESKLGL